MQGDLGPSYQLRGLLQWVLIWALPSIIYTVIRATFPSQNKIMTLLFKALQWLPIIFRTKPNSLSWHSRPSWLRLQPIIQVSPQVPISCSLFCSHLLCTLLTVHLVRSHCQAFVEAGPPARTAPFISMLVRSSLSFSVSSHSTSYFHSSTYSP